jgi:type IV pilus assembly protein PilW
MLNMQFSKARGFSLIELMVALVLGLIVVGAVLALVTSIMKSNRQTIQSTRLTQELRATVAVIAADLKRARSVNDPLVTATATGGNPFKDINYATANCIRYGYDDASDDDGDGNASNDNWHTIRLSGGRVVRASAATEAAATCALTGVKLGSDQILISALTFTPTAPAVPAVDTVRSFDVTISGNLIDADAETASISRTITEAVYIRSIGIGN